MDGLLLFSTVIVVSVIGKLGYSECVRSRMIQKERIVQEDAYPIRIEEGDKYLIWVEDLSHPIRRQVESSSPMSEQDWELIV